MPNTCIVGVQWGDEGKGKIVDLLAGDYDFVVRYQGGCNAGHTVVIGDEEFILHLIPSGVLHPGVVCVIGNGVVVDPVVLLEEIEALRKRGIEVDENLKISDRAHIVLPYHKRLDAASEKKRGEKKIGSTLRGIAPCYADKMARMGIRIGDLYSPASFRARLEENIQEKNRLLGEIYSAEPLNPDDIYETYLECAEKMRPFVTDTVFLINEAVRAGKSLLFEGAQGSLLDVDFGTYNYITSSNATASGVSPGSGLPPMKLDQVIGVAKAYTTRVGEGPFPTELSDEIGERLRERGREYGATTGRPRRCGWFDAVACRFTTMINGCETIALTKLDVLDMEPRIKLCVAYESNGKSLENFPASLETLNNAKPIYEELPGWQEKTSGITKFKQLPQKAKVYLDFLKKTINTEISFISIGRERNQIIRL